MVITAAIPRNEATLYHDFVYKGREHRELAERLRVGLTEEDIPAIEAFLKETGWMKWNGGNNSYFQGDVLGLVIEKSVVATLKLFSDFPEVLETRIAVKSKVSNKSRFLSGFEFAALMHVVAVEQFVAGYLASAELLDRHGKGYSIEEYKKKALVAALSFDEPSSLFIAENHPDIFLEVVTSEELFKIAHKYPEVGKLLKAQPKELLEALLRE